MRVILAVVVLCLFLAINAMASIHAQAATPPTSTPTSIPDGCVIPTVTATPNLSATAEGTPKLSVEATPTSSVTPEIISTEESPSSNCEKSPVGIAFEKANITTSLNKDGELVVTIDGKQATFPKSHEPYGTSPEVKWGINYVDTSEGVKRYKNDVMIYDADMESIPLQNDKNSKPYKVQLPVFYVLEPRLDGSFLKVKFTGRSETLGFSTDRTNGANKSGEDIVKEIQDAKKKGIMLRAELDLTGGTTTAKIMAHYRNEGKSCEQGKDGNYCYQSIGYNAVLGSLLETDLIPKYNNKHYQSSDLITAGGVAAIRVVDVREGN